MNEQVFQNFRDMSVAVLHAPDSNRQILADTLARLGLRTTLIDPQKEDPRARNVVGSVDILFFDADAIEDNLAGFGCGTASIPLIAVLGLETPSRLQRTFELGPSALLHKPLRPTGIYTALFFAVNEFRRRQKLVARLTDVEARHGARRFVVKAVLTLAERHNVDDEEAFRMLRVQSMKQRLTVEEMAIRLVASRYGGSGRNALRA
jgi:AmiR/NasT family two-component response regulator